MDSAVTRVESLQRACGAVEVAKDLLGRSEAVYRGAADIADHLVVERYANAAQALAEVVEALEVHLRTTRLGPAA